MTPCPTSFLEGREKANMVKVFAFAERVWNGVFCVPFGGGRWSLSLFIYVSICLSVESIYLLVYLSIVNIYAYMHECVCVFLSMYVYMCIYMFSPGLPSMSGRHGLRGHRHLRRLVPGRECGHPPGASNFQALGTGATSLLDTHAHTQIDTYICVYIYIYHVMSGFFFGN